MGSKTPPPGQAPQADLKEDGAGGHPPSANSAINPTPLQRIANALQIPPDALYQMSDANKAACRPGGQAEDYSGREGECSALIHAFLRIADPEERRRILALVQASAERA